MKEWRRAAFCWFCRLEVIYFGILNKDLKLMKFASWAGLKAQIKQHALFYLKGRTIAEGRKALLGGFSPQVTKRRMDGGKLPHGVKYHRKQISNHMM